MPSPEERDLKVLFDALRNEELQHTPPYSARSPIHGRTMRVRFRLAMAGVLMLSIAALVIVSLPSDPPATATIPIAEWKAPTDFLLLTPGHDLMQSAPRFGDVKGVSR